MAYTLSQSVDPITPSIVLIGVPDKSALERVIQKLKHYRIEFSVFDEPDHDLGLTAVSTIPLTPEQRSVLQNYKLWNENDLSHARSSVVRAPSSSQEDAEAGGSNPSARANGQVDNAMQKVLILPCPPSSRSSAAVASVSKTDYGGSNPLGSASFVVSSTSHRALSASRLRPQDSQS